MPSTASTSSPVSPLERVVHAQHTDGSVIVRLDRAGKWFHEPVQGKRQGISVKEAAALASGAGWTINADLYGGKLFHSALNKIQG